MERGTFKLTDLRIQQALWSCISRHNVNARLEVKGHVKDQTPLHLIALSIPSLDSDGGEREEGGRVEKLQPLSEGAYADRLEKWSAKKALIRLRQQLEKQGTPVEKWTFAHDLLCLVLDLGANAELKDASKRTAAQYCKAPSVRALLESDWELGEKTCQGSTLTENGVRFFPFSTNIC